MHFCYVARGSLYEVLTLFEIFKRKKWIDLDQFQQIQQEGIEIASMLKGLINSIGKSVNK